MAKKVTKGKKMTSEEEAMPTSVNDQITDSIADNDESATDDTSHQGTAQFDEADTDSEHPQYDQEQLLGQFESGKYYSGNDSLQEHEYLAQKHQFQEGHFYRGNNIVPESEYRSAGQTQNQPVYYPNPTATAQAGYGQGGYPYTAYCQGYYPGQYYQANPYAQNAALGYTQYYPYFNPATVIPTVPAMGCPRY